MIYKVYFRYLVTKWYYLPPVIFLFCVFFNLNTIKKAQNAPFLDYMMLQNYETKKRLTVRLSFDFAYS